MQVVNEEKRKMILFSAKHFLLFAVISKQVSSFYTNIVSKLRIISNSFTLDFWKQCQPYRAVYNYKWMYLHALYSNELTASHPIKKKQLLTSIAML